MKKIAAFLATVSLAGLAVAQTGSSTSWRNGDRMAGTKGTSPQGEAIVQKVTVTDASGTANPAGTAADPIYVSGGGGGGGDATAANQTTQIAAEQAIRDRIGDVTTPATGSVNQRLSLSNTSLSTLAGTVAAAGSPAANAQTIQANALPLPNGAATSALQTSGNTSLSTIAGAVSGNIMTVGGNVASGAADSGNGNKISGVYTSATRAANGTGGTRGDAQVDPYNNLNARMVGSIPAAPVSTGTTVALVQAPNSNTAANGVPLGTFAYFWNGTNTVPSAGDANGGYMVSKGGSNIATGQVSVGTTSTLVVAARAGRQKTILSVGAANTCAFGNTGVTSTTGFPLQPTAGASLTLDTAAAIYAACSATTAVSYIEQF